MSRLAQWLLNAPDRVQRTLALFILFFLLAGVGATIELAANSITSLQAEIRDRRELLGRLAAVADLGARVHTAVGPATVASSDDEFLSGGNEAVARAGLQSRLTAIAGRTGAQLQSIGNLPTEAINGSRYVGIRVEMAGTIEMLHEVVLQIETTRPWLLIDGGSIWTSGNLESSRAMPPKISARIEVFGALAPEIASPPGEVAAK